MPHEGYVDPVMNDGPRVHSNVPVSELTKRITRAIEANDVSSAPPVARNRGWGNAQNSTDPYQAQRGSRAQDTQNTSAAPGSATPTRPNPSARPTPGSTSLPHPIPRLSLGCTRCTVLRP